MAIIRSLRALPVLVVALVALFVVASGSALASSHAASLRSTVAAKHHEHKRHAKHKRHKKHKKHKRHSSPAPVPTPMPIPAPSGSGTGSPSGSGSGSPATPSAPKSFVARDAGQTAIGTGLDGTVIESLSLPANAKYVVTAKAELGNASANPNSVSCQLLENFNPLDSGTQALAPQATFSGTISLTATSTGGTLKLSCTGEKAAFARNRVIAAVQTS